MIKARLPAEGSVEAILTLLQAKGYTVQFEAPDFSHEDLDLIWNRVLLDGTLECRDRNSGLEEEPEKRPRVQWRRWTGRLWHRRLPPEKFGEVWRDNEMPGMPAIWCWFVGQS